MAKFCLPKKVADDFVSKLQDGTIDPEKMVSMTSEERNKFLSGIVGEENGKSANALFESKLMLKNQKRGMISWAENIMGVKPGVKRDIVSTIMRMDKVLSPEEGQMFMSDLAERKLGVSITAEEAKNISNLANKAEQLRSSIPENLPDGHPKRVEYGASNVELLDYVSKLKTDASKMKLKEYFSTKGFFRAINDTAGLAKAMKASLDDSAVFRQGWKTMFTNPGTWGKNAVKTFGDIGRSMKGEDVMKVIKAEVYSRKNAINGKYDMAKLEVGMNEEAYPTSVPERVPGLGRLFTASETAFKGFLMRMRADIFDKTVSMAERAGVNVNDAYELQGIGKLVNSITGRGDLGPLEKIGKNVNNVFFSPKLIKSHIDTLTAHTGQDMSKFAKKRAAINLAKIVSSTAVILGIAKALDKDSVDFDPRSSDFGKIKVGNTRFDVTGGMSSIVTLAARILPSKDETGNWGQYSKSSVTGKISKINSGTYGSMTALDVAVNFGSNKLSPMARLVLELAQQKDFNNNPITLVGEASNLLMPLPINTFQNLRSDPNSANILLAMIAEGMGISTNTYGTSKPKLQGFFNNKKVDTSIVTEVDRLSKVGEAPAIGDVNNLKDPKTFKTQTSLKNYRQFIRDFQSSYEKSFADEIKTADYKSLDDKEKGRTLEKLKMSVLQDTLDKYNYEPPESTSSASSSKGQSY